MNGWISRHAAVLCLTSSAILAVSAAGAQDVGSIAVWGWDVYDLWNVPEPNSGFVAVACGSGHSLGLRADGSIAAWGDNYYGQCDVPLPNSGFVAVAAGCHHSLGLRADGSIEAWGHCDWGECDVPGTGFVAVAGGGFHSLGLRANGSIAAWGQTLGDVPLPNSEFVAVAGGLYHSLGLHADGSIAAWGQCDYFWQCNVPGPNSGFVAMAGGEYYSLCLRADGSIAAWGWCGYGECDVPGGGFVAVAAGDHHSLGLRTDGSIAAWGDNSRGQCDVPAPNGGFVAVDGGMYHSLGLRERGWTTLVYLNGDNSLDVASENDFNEMERVAWKQDIVVCWDRLGPDNSAYYHVRWDSDPSAVGVYADNVNRWPQGELNMGDPNTLTDFTQWAISRYPAQHYLLVIWNHGNGWGPREGRGVSWDETDCADFLTTNELRDAVEAIADQIGADVDVLAFDACLMQMVEVAYSVREHCTTVVGSEETEPAAGWNYSTFLTAVNPSSTAEDVCTSAVATYGAQGFPTQSAFRTQELSNLAQCVDLLAGALINNMLMERYNIWNARRDPDLATFDYAGFGPQRNANSYVDLGQLCTLFAASCYAPDVQNAATAVRSAIASARIANATNGSYYAPAEGISIYFPDHYPDYSGTEDFYANYQNSAGAALDANLDFVADTGWDEFLAALLEITGDFNTDGRVDFADFNIFVGCMSSFQSICFAGDFNYDGMIDLDDFLAFQSSYTGP